MKVFRVVVEEPPREEREFMPSLRGQVSHVVEVAQDAMKANLLSLVEDLAAIFNQIPVSNGFGPERIDVSVSISGTGGIELVGKVSTTVTGGMTISFQRSKS